MAAAAKTHCAKTAAVAVGGAGSPQSNDMVRTLLPFLLGPALQLQTALALAHDLARHASAIVLGMCSKTVCCMPAQKHVSRAAMQAEAAGGPPDMLTGMSWAVCFKTSCQECTPGLCGMMWLPYNVQKC